MPVYVNLHVTPVNAHMHHRRQYSMRQGGWIAAIGVTGIVLAVLSAMQAQRREKGDTKIWTALYAIGVGTTFLAVLSAMLLPLMHTLWPTPPPPPVGAWLLWRQDTGMKPESTVTHVGAWYPRQGFDSESDCLAQLPHLHQELLAIAASANAALTRVRADDPRRAQGLPPLSGDFARYAQVFPAQPEVEDHTMQMTLYLPHFGTTRTTYACLPAGSKPESRRR
jgi:hypothetical protein